MSIKRRQFLTSMGGAAGMAVLPGSALAQAKPAAGKQPLYKNAAAPVEARVEDLLSRMTLEEKVMQLHCIWIKKYEIQDAKGAFSADKARARFPHGIGMIARPSDRRLAPNEGAAAGDDQSQANRGARDTAEYSNAAQKWAIEQTRLGIPLLLHEEALHGYAAKDATSFPQAIALASSFDPELVQQVFSVAGAEVRARGANMVLAPVVDVAREPRWGRIEETFGEDPYVCYAIGKAAVRGFSGDVLPLPPTKVLTTLKHLTGHGQPESGTNIGPANLGERNLREDFFPPFEKIIKETKVAAVMPSYNEIDGVPSHANRWMLTKVMRGEWKFRGVAVSDYFAVNELVSRHKLVANTKEAGLYALKAGVDIETPDAEGYNYLIALLKEKKISQADIDTAVRRVLRIKFEGGLFEHPYADANAAEGLTATPQAVALARKAAGRCAVLLKNENNILPLQPQKIGRVLLVGTHANDTPIGGYSDVPRHVVSVYEALQKEAKDQGFALKYSEGVRITEERIWGKDEIKVVPREVNDRLIAQAVQDAKDADTIIMVLGDNEQTSREAWADQHLGDRVGLDLFGQQNELAAAMFATGKPVIVVLLNGRPLSINLLAEKANAILEGWYLGQETGHGVADVLFGRVNPGGKLPVSFARHVGQLPIFYNRKPSARRGYIDGSTKPLYPFGFGLSYTTFDISQPRLAKARIGTDGSTVVEVDVANTGRVAGDEVVQIYIRDDVSSVTRPLLELKAFQRVTLQPGERRTLRFDIKPSDLWFFNTDMRRVVEPGTFTIYAGPNSVDLKSTQLTVI
jgi:beta-glucosidase